MLRTNPIINLCVFPFLSIRFNCVTVNIDAIPATPVNVQGVAGCCRGSCEDVMCITGRSGIQKDGMYKQLCRLSVIGLGAINDAAMSRTMFIGEGIGSTLVDDGHSRQRVEHVEWNLFCHQQMGVKSTHHAEEWWRDILPGSK